MPAHRYTSPLRDKLENLFQVFFHALVVDGITLFLEEADDENVEEHPVRPYGRTVAVT